MQTGLEKILSSLQLEQCDSTTSSATLSNFIGYGSDDSGERIYGGQVMAQAMSAAQQTVAPAFKLHAMHSSFLRQGALDKAVRYEVDAVRDGRSFITRNIVAFQAGNNGNERPIFSATLSFHKQENGPTHSATMPDVPPAESLTSEKQRISELFKSLGRDSNYEWPIDVRYVNPVDLANPTSAPPRALVWLKTAHALPDNDATHRQMFVYASDNPILMPAFYPHGINPFTPGVMAATLSHSIWIHQAPRIDDWLLFEIDSDFTGSGRGMGRAKVFNRNGVLVASAVQEGLVRQR